MSEGPGTAEGIGLLVDDITLGARTGTGAVVSEVEVEAVTGNGVEPEVTEEGGRGADPEKEAARRAASTATGGGGGRGAGTARPADRFSQRLS